MDQDSQYPIKAVPTPEGSEVSSDIDEDADKPKLDDNEYDDKVTYAMKLKFGTSRDDFDPWKTPPNFDDAEKHAIAKRVNQLASRLEADQYEDEDNVCPCCHFPIENNAFGLWQANPQDLGELGSGFALYYDLIKWLIFMMMLWLVFQIFSLIDNYSAGKEGEWDEDLDGHVIISGSMAAHGEDDSPSMIQAWLNAVMQWSLLVVYVVIHLWHKNLTQKIDDLQISPPDFTIYIRNIPRDTTADEIKEWIQTNGLPDGKRPEIVKVILAYDIDEFVEVQRKFTQWRIKLEKARDKANWCQTSKEKCKRKIADMAEDLDILQGKVTESNFAGKAFVTFKWEEEAKIAQKFLTSDESHSNWWFKLRHVLCFHVPRANVPLKGEKLIVERPDEPNDILWENLGERGAFKRRAITSIAMLIILVICGLIIYASAEWKKELKDNHKKDPSDSEAVVELIQQFIPAVIISLINLVLTFTIKVFTKLEKFDSITAYNTAVSLKLTGAMFINTAVIVLIVYRDDWYGSDALIVEVYNIVIANAILAPLIYLFDMEHIIRRTRQWWERRKGSRSQLNQQQANDLFQGVDIDMAERSSYLMKTYLLAMLYGPMLPIAYLITAISFVVEYWLDKYLLLRRHTRPERMGDNLDKTILRFLPIGVLINWVGSMLFHYDYNRSSLIPTMTGMIVCFLFLITPWVRIINLREILSAAHIIRKMSSVGPGSDIEQQPYEYYSPEFVFDFDRENPLTSSEAAKQWIELINQQKGEQTAKATQKHVMGKIQGSALGNLIAYSNKKMPALKNFAKQAQSLQMGQSIQKLIGMDKGPVKPDKQEKPMDMAGILNVSVSSKQSKAKIEIPRRRKQRFTTVVRKNTRTFSPGIDSSTAKAENDVLKDTGRK